MAAAVHPYNFLDPARGTVEKKSFLDIRSTMPGSTLDVIDPTVLLPSLQ